MADLSFNIPEYTPGGQATLIASGSTSSLSAYSGPWFIERQTLTIDYVRVPIEVAPPTYVTRSLTQYNNPSSMSVYHTALAVIVRASYDSSIDYNTYQLSSQQLPQRFDVQSVSSDPYGNDYGALNASALGPRGTIVTTQPYYNRVPYTGASWQVPTSKTIVASNWGATYDAFGSAVPYSMSQVFSNFDFFKDAREGCLPGNLFFKPNGLKVGLAGGHLALVMGNYSVASEPANIIRDVINVVANSITTSNLFNFPDTSITSAGYPLPDQGFVEYDVGRHQY